MSEEFESLNSRIPDLGTALVQRIASKKAEESGNTPPPPGTVDPYQLMLKKKQGEEIKEIDPATIQRWPEAAVTKLQDYCTKMGIVGFSSGKMPPLVALAMLKKQFGDDYTGIPLEERVPEGYEKAGTRPQYNPGYPYSQAILKKQILHG